MYEPHVALPRTTPAPQNAFVPYGWPVDLSDDDLLARLLGLNLELAAPE